jgi:hypothetical protein
MERKKETADQLKTPGSRPLCLRRVQGVVQVSKDKSIANLSN